MSEETLLVFPCQFPIKAMGKNQAELEITVIELIRRHAPHTHEQAITSRNSKNDNYLALTIMIDAHSKQQLDAIYQDLTAHPLILYVL
jgi:putative lipoic acid-binding regulatory protein